MKELVTLQAFRPQDKEVKKIVEICDLRPSGWKHWDSPFGNFMMVHEKELSVRAKKTSIVPKDIYWNSNPTQLLSLSKLIAYNEGYLLLWGEDDYARVFVFFDDIDDWRRVCPLSMSINSLRGIIQFERLNVSHDKSREYAQTICRLPPSNESLQYLIQSNKEICHDQIQSLIEVF